MTSQNHLYDSLTSLVISVAAFITEWLPARLTAYLWYLSAVLTLATKFAIVKAGLFIHGKSWPPNFNVRFETPLVGMKQTRVRWAAEAPGRQKEDPVILYLHGGGYAVATQIPQIKSLRDLYFAAENPRLSILVLEYTTSTYAAYPTQLREAAEVYNALASTCSNIIILGDSAGGHLGLQLMRHSVNPELSVARVHQRPAAYIGISPAVDMNPFKDIKSHPNSRHDIHSVGMAKVWPKWFAKENAVRDGPILRLQLDKKTNWEAALPPPERIFISYGGREILVDSIKNFVASTGLDKNGATIYSHPSDVHSSLFFFGASSPVMKPVVEFLNTLPSSDVKSG